MVLAASRVAVTWPMSLRHCLPGHAHYGRGMGFGSSTRSGSEVTELIIAQLLYLNYESADKPVGPAAIWLSSEAEITLYINSTGSTIKNNTRPGRQRSF